jgi:hypothetical protein
MGIFLVMEKKYMDTKINKLAERVRLLSDLLSEHGEDGWAGFLETCHEQIISGEPYGLEELNTVFGSMGSFNDMVLTHRNGLKLSQEEINEANDKLSTLNSEIFSRLIDLQIKDN